MKTYAQAKATGPSVQHKLDKAIPSAAVQPESVSNVGTPAEHPSGSRHSVSRIPIQANDIDNRSSGRNGVRGTPEEDHTGLPDDLKVGIENLSGFSLDDVRVHYNSAKPVQLQALAYTQGTEIHVGPGQEKHLAHEAWHVVQQKQGRVNPMLPLNGMNLNTDTALEKEADALAAKVSQVTGVTVRTPFMAGTNFDENNPGQNQTADVYRNNHHDSNGRDSPVSNPVQLKTTVDWTAQEFPYADQTNPKVWKKGRAGYKMRATLDPNDPKQGASTTSNEMNKLFQSLNTYWEPGTKHWVRGHLLNDNLGGKNVSINLFPITGHANGDHLNNVERVIKDWIRAGAEVYYEVTAKRYSGTVDGVPNAAGELECYAYVKDRKSAPDSYKGKSLHRTIKSTPIRKTKLAGATNPAYSKVEKHKRSIWNYDTVDDSQALDPSLPHGWGKDPLNQLNKQGRKSWKTNQKRSGWFSTYWVNE